MMQTRVTVSADQMAKVLKMTPRRVQQLCQTDGMPKVSHNKYDLVECVWWYLDYLRSRPGHSETAVAQRVELDKLKTEKLRLDLAERKGDLTSFAETARQLQGIMSVLKAELLGVPGRVCHKLVGKNAGEIKKLLRAEQAKALNRAAAKIRDGNWCDVDDVAVEVTDEPGD